MRISDWSSDVCSSDLQSAQRGAAEGRRDAAEYVAHGPRRLLDVTQPDASLRAGRAAAHPAHLGVAGLGRKSGGQGKSVSVRVALGGRRILKKQQLHFKIRLTLDIDINTTSQQQ